MLGFAYASGSSRGRPTASRPRTRSTCTPKAPGQGLGKALLAELVARRGGRRAQDDRGDRRLGQRGSIGVHRALGFTPVGTLKSCGWKFGRWLDIVLMEKTLGEGDTTPARGVNRVRREQQDPRCLAGLPGRPLGPAPLLPARRRRPLGWLHPWPTLLGLTASSACAARRRRPLELARSPAGLHHRRLRARRHRLRADDAEKWSARFGERGRAAAGTGRPIGAVVVSR